MDTNHAYYYQVQTQLFLCDVEYCDFVVCTFSDEGSMHIERISKNLIFWNDCVSKAVTFYRTCVLPELIGKWYTRPITSNVDNQHDEEVKNTSKSSEYCYCHGYVTFI